MILFYLQIIKDTPIYEEKVKIWELKELINDLLRIKILGGIAYEALHLWASIFLVITVKWGRVIQQIHFITRKLLDSLNRKLIFFQILFWSSLFFWILIWTCDTLFRWVCTYKFLRIHIMLCCYRLPCPYLLDIFTYTNDKTVKRYLVRSSPPLYEL